MLAALPFARYESERGGGRVEPKNGLDPQLGADDPRLQVVSFLTGKAHR